MSVVIPFVRDIDVDYGRCDELTPLIRRVTANNPSPFSFKGTGTYIIGRGEVAVIDPGPMDDAHLAAILAATEGERITHIPITHTHSDHSPLAAPLKERTGAKTYGFGPHGSGKAEWPANGRSRRPRLYARRRAKKTATSSKGPVGRWRRSTRRGTPRTICVLS